MPDVIQKQRKVLMNVQCRKYKQSSQNCTNLDFIQFLVLQIQFNFEQFLKSQMHQNFCILKFLDSLHFGTCICSYYTYTYEKYNKQTYLANSSIQPRFSLLLWLKWARFESTNWVYCYELPNYFELSNKRTCTAIYFGAKIHPVQAY